MKKVLIALLLVLLIISCVGCNRQVSSEAIVSDTNEIWNNSKINQTTEQIIFKKLDIGGIATVNNLVFDLEKKVDNDKISVNLETRKAMSVKIKDSIKDIIDLVLDYNKVDGDLQVKHLEQAMSKIGLRANFQMDKSSAKGFVEFLNVNDMFKDNMSKSQKFEIDLTGLENNNNFQAIYHQLKCHPISTFVPSIKDSFNLFKEVPIAFCSDEICNIANAIAGNNSDMAIGDSNITIKRLLFDAFAETDGTNVVKDVLQIKNPTAKFNLVRKDNKDFIDKISVNGTFNINLSKSELDIIAKDLTTAYKNEELYNILKNLINLLNYEQSFITSELEVVVENRVIK